MVTNLQFAAVAAYLLWCLFASLSDRLEPEPDDAEAYESPRNEPVGSYAGAPWDRDAGRESNDRAEDADRGSA